MTVDRIKHDPILARFTAAVLEEYGNKVERVVLYGSRARGDARPDSDYDVAVFLRSGFDLGRDLFKLADLGTVLLEDTGALIHAMPFPAGSYAERTPLMHEIRRSGIDL
jgi:predicted nucleotidyltransferase